MKPNLSRKANLLFQFLKCKLEKIPECPVMEASQRGREVETIIKNTAQIPVLATCNNTLFLLVFTNTL